MQRKHGDEWFTARGLKDLDLSDIKARSSRPGSSSSSRRRRPVKQISLKKRKKPEGNDEEVAGSENGGDKKEAGNDNIEKSVEEKQQEEQKKLEEEGYTRKGRGNFKSRRSLGDDQPRVAVERRQPIRVEYDTKVEMVGRFSVQKASSSSNYHTKRGVNIQKDRRKKARYE